MTHIDTAELYARSCRGTDRRRRDRRRATTFSVSKCFRKPSRRGTSRPASASAGCSPTTSPVSVAWLDASRSTHAWSFVRCEAERSAPMLPQFASRAAGRREYRGPCRIVLQSCVYHLQERAIEHQVLPYCEEQGIAVVGYSPFGSGRFPSASSPGGRTLQAIAEAHQATPRQVALAFLVRRPSLFAIPKASKVAHALENAGAGDLELTASESSASTQRSREAGPVRGVPTL